MNRWTVLIVALLAFVAMSCSGGGDNPVAPAELDMAGPSGQAVQSQNHLWGYYDCYVDLDSQTVVASLNRSVMFAANVVTFVNGSPANLQFQIVSTPIQPTHVDVDINVGITHPFPGMSQYDGYDVRGIFIGDGSGGLDYNSDLDFPRLGTDQIIVGSEGPGGTDGAPDGYTRWWNPSEFTAPGVLGYTPGLFASPGYSGDATLNGYKYFADGLSMTGDAFEWVSTHVGSDGVFTAGTTNRRNYYLRFPNAKGTQFNYAICANWESETEHPSNAPEAPVCRVEIEDNVYYVDSGTNGGALKLDISPWNWGGFDQPSTIYVESNVVSAMYTLDATDMIPIGGDINYSTYHVEIDADNVTGNDGNNFWVICEYPGLDYTNTMGVPNTANTDTLAAFFRHDLFTWDEVYNMPPQINSGVTGEALPAEWSIEVYNVDAIELDGELMTYTWTITDGNGDPLVDYDEVPGDGAGNLTVDWGEICGWVQGAIPYDIDCIVDDGLYFVPADTLECKIWVDGDWWVSNHPDFDSNPKYGTMDNPFETIGQALAFYSAGETIVVDYGTGVYDGQVSKDSGDSFTLRGFSWYTMPVGRPTIQKTGSPPIYIRYTNDVTIQGFTISPGPGVTTQNQIVYAYYANNFTFIDNHVTGTIDYYYLYCMYIYYSDNMVIKNNLFSSLNTNSTYTYAYIYFYFYRGNGVHNVTQNEFTTFQDTTQTPGYMYIYQYGYYWPANSNWTNNLMHHIAPDSGTYFSMYLNRIYYPYATANVENNTVDMLSCDNGINSSSSRLYGMYVYRGSSTMYGYDLSSNIVSNVTGTYTMPTYYGIYAYNQSPTYNNVWNIQDIPYGFSGPGTGSISADPMFVNNTTDPYDYTLATGSPCIGTGKSGVDMGCYGNLPAGEVVGLLTPE